MTPVRLAAYAVAPSRTGGSSPVGGMAVLTTEMQAALEEAYRRVRPRDWTPVDFRFDDTTRTCAARDLLLSFAFDDTEASAAAAEQLANRLGQAMDNRSHPFLLMIAGYGDAESRRVVIWAFPRDDAFRFLTSSGAPQVELLEDVFSRTSGLRKAADFEGRRERASFLSGQVLDLQSSASQATVAVYWIEGFLMCTLGVTPEMGTRVLAQALRDTFRAVEDTVARTALQTAAIALRHGPAGSVSLDDFADRYLTPDLGEQVRSHSPEPTINGARFQFQPDTFDRLVRLEVFTLDTGVLVTAPLDQIGESVTLEDGRLTAAGTVVGQRLRGGRA